MSGRQLSILAALNMMAAVGAGAFGAHGLKNMISPERLAVWQTGVLYHLVHALGLFIIALLSLHWRSPALTLAGRLMFAGILMFSGSLYMLAFAGTRWLGAITPIGGAAFLLAWALVAWAAYRQAA